MNKSPVGVIPKVGDYHVPLNILIELCTDIKMMDCPPITAKTVEIGAKHSPDTVCTPFKVIMGNFIESLDKGATTLIMPGFGCRLGFYDMLHEQILQDLGYNFEMIAICDYTATPHRIFNSLSKINPDLTRERFDEVFLLVSKLAIDLDEFAALVRKDSAFEVEKGSFQKLYKQYLVKARKLVELSQAIDLGDQYRTLFAQLKTDRPKEFLRIGLIGDLYSVIEPHGNCEMESWLIKNKVEIVRPTDMTFLAKNIFNVPSMIEQSGGYVDYGIGGNANCTVMQAYQMVTNKQVDGIIHVKAATCSPEISAMSILQTMMSDFNIPAMYLTFDTETGEAGVHTRLEAFCDMITMKKQKAVV